MNIELVLKFVVSANCRKFQVTSVFIAVVFGCALASTLEAQTASPDNGPISVAQPADGPDIEVVSHTNARRNGSVRRNGSCRAVTNTARSAI